MHALFLAGLLIGVPMAGGTDEVARSAAPPSARAIVIGPEYHAGSIHRSLWGTDYRALWTAPVQVEVLDLQHYAGGLKPVARVGGRETKGLAGQIYEYPRGRSERNPGFRGAVEVVKHDEFYKRIAADPAERVDARAFL